MRNPLPYKQPLVLKIGSFQIRLSNLVMYPVALIWENEINKLFTTETALQEIGICINTQIKGEMKRDSSSSAYNSADFWCKGHHVRKYFFGQKIQAMTALLTIKFADSLHGLPGENLAPCHLWSARKELLRQCWCQAYTPPMLKGIVSQIVAPIC